MASIVDLTKWLNLPTLREGAGSETGPCPFDISLRGEGTNYRLTIYPGLVNGLLPDNYLSGILIPNNGEHYIYLVCTSSNGNITSVTLQAYSTPQQPSLPTLGYPPSSLRILMGIVIGSTSYKIATCSNYAVESEESFRLQKASPVIGMLPYDIYYNWRVGT